MEQDKGIFSKYSQAAPALIHVGHIKPVSFTKDLNYGFWGINF